MYKLKFLFFISFFCTVLLGSFLLFYVDPWISGEHGEGLLQLQLAFDLTKGQGIITKWGELGIANFNKWIWVDFVYPVSYSLTLFLALCITVPQKIMRIRYWPWIAGGLDWGENIIEIICVNYSCSAQLFFIHSLLASLKWIIVTGLVGYLILSFRHKIMLSD